MYLEERVEQLENLSVDQGRQLESLARGLANLTLDVRAIRTDQNAGFARVDEQFTAVNTEFAKVNKRLDDHSEQFADIKTTLQLVVKLLTER